MLSVQSVVYLSVGICTDCGENFVNRGENFGNYGRGVGGENFGNRGENFGNRGVDSENFGTIPPADISTWGGT